jgi:hypothetical protein
VSTFTVSGAERVVVDVPVPVPVVVVVPVVTLVAVLAPALVVLLEPLGVLDEPQAVRGASAQQASSTERHLGIELVRLA